MTYEITPAHFGYTNWKKLVLAVSWLAILTLGPVLLEWIISLLWPGSSWATRSWDWRERDILGGVFAAAVFEFEWSFAHNYSLEIDEDSARVGGRVVRRGHVRYLRELDGNLWEGPRLVISEHGPVWVQFLGGVVVVPKGLPDYEQIRTRVSMWVVDAAADAEKC